MKRFWQYIVSIVTWPFRYFQGPAASSAKGELNKADHIASARVGFFGVGGAVVYETVKEVIGPEFWQLAQSYLGQLNQTLEMSILIRVLLWGAISLMSAFASWAAMAAAERQRRKSNDYSTPGEPEGDGNG